ncbi:carbohydrate ABC transporter permease [Actinokineospora globicatena]|uniref:carbohydrate ABC transporter permease n=1 Tax=Actinokineospora globicatena TaxID=103729 RepID=UPI0020A32DF7|nr:sugar ABC transporter permease [Actinokineospora globicatena]MCP2306827.1 N,N'-diacetylchitobiose transport system permease protein [Actinokineospora globicatena]GLW82268.1 sugar ABC transporter permease [Actinokineospora globicatena]GLW89139.1 sugar ABC transporter permease [Actinokineospora globicatena]
MTSTVDTARSAGTPPPAARPGARRRARRPLSETALPYLMLAPAVVVMLALLAWPALQVLAISFRKLDLGELVRGEIKWVGFDNYTSILTDPEFWVIGLRTLLFTITVVLATLLLGLGIAVLMRHLSGWVRGVLQVCLVLAWATPIIATTTVFQWIFDQQYGILNKTLVLIGFDSFKGYSWFTSGTSTLAVIGLLVIWQAVPFIAFTLYAGLVNTPSDLYEAAAIDGASGWSAFRAVSWPSVRPLLTLVTFLSVLWDFKVFTQVWAIRQGGPDGESTTLPVLLYLRGIAASHFGVSAAVAVLMLVVLVAVTWRYMRLLVRSPETEL